jgi:hypothetical protein
LRIWSTAAGRGTSRRVVQSRAVWSPQRQRTAILAPIEEDMDAYHKQVVSKARVADHGEVYTAAQEVGAMVDLVAQESERIDSRFLEPACGNGNFLAEVLRRKLAVVTERYRASQIEYERYAILAVSSLYGIDILSDNVTACRERLLGLFLAAHERLFPGPVTDALRATAAYILSRNIVHGDALTLKTVEAHPRPITLPEWSPVNGSLLKRRDFSYGGLLQHEGLKELPIWSDLGESAFIPVPVRDYPVVHFLKFADADE